MMVWNRTYAIFRQDVLNDVEIDNMNHCLQLQILTIGIAFFTDHCIHNGFFSGKFTHYGPFFRRSFVVGFFFSPSLFFFFFFLTETHPAYYKFCNFFPSQQTKIFTFLSKYFFPFSANKYFYLSQQQNYFPFSANKIFYLSQQTKFCSLLNIPFFYLSPQTIFLPSQQTKSFTFLSKQHFSLFINQIFFLFSANRNLTRYLYLGSDKSFWFTGNLNSHKIFP